MEKYITQYPEDVRGTIRKNTAITKLDDKMYAAISFIIEPESGKKIEAQSIGRTEKHAKSKIMGSMLHEIKKHEMSQISAISSAQNKKRKRYGNRRGNF